MKTLKDKLIPMSKGTKIAYEKDVVEAIRKLKEVMNGFVWDMAQEYGGSALHYWDLVNEKIDKIFGDFEK